MRGPNDSASSIPIITAKHFSSPEVNEEHLPLVIHDRVLRLDIPVDDVLGVQVFHCQDDWPQVVPIGGFVQDAYLSNRLKHLNAIDILQ